MRIMNHKSRPWTENEYTLLRSMSEAGADVLSMSKALDRTIGSVLAQMHKTGIPIPRSTLGLRTNEIGDADGR